MTETKGLSLGERVFGENDSDRVRTLFFKENGTKEEAQEVLGAITNKEIRKILTTLEDQMKQGQPIARYNFHKDFWSKPVEGILFTDWSYQMGFLWSFYQLLKKAYPNYKLSREQPVCEIIMERR